MYSSSRSILAATDSIDAATKLPSCNSIDMNGQVIDRQRFFKQLPGLTSVAHQLKVPTTFIVGLSSFESGCYDNHNVGLNNLWGLTQNGGNNMKFPSPEAGNAYFVKRVGPFIQGAQSTPDFFNGLKKKGYNSKNPNYYSLLAGRISSIQNWGQACGVTF